MEDHYAGVQVAGAGPTSTPWWVSGATYSLALVAGVVLVCTDHATATEASGFVAQFLVIYERMLRR